MTSSGGCDAGGAMRSSREWIAEQIAVRAQRQFDERAGSIFAVLRRFHPVVANRAFAVVTRDADVGQVLQDHVGFSVHENGLRMRRLSGPFILGEDDTPLYRRHAAALQRCVRAEDLSRIEEYVARHAKDRLDACARTGAIDLVGQYADPVLASVSGWYLGAPGPSAANQARWAKDIFHELFINLANVPSIRRRGERSAAQMREHIDALIWARRQIPADSRDDLLDRLLGLVDEPRLTDSEIRDNLVGLITGWIPTASKALTLGMLELLRHPEAVESARAAALRNDYPHVRAHLWEAMRFRPQNSVLVRRCEGDRVIAAGTPRETTIRGGATVLAAIQSAMMDEAVIDDPTSYRPGRPPGAYQHFGQGLHTCWGEHINERQLPVLAAELLKRPGLRRAPGSRGKISWDGPYPGSAILEFR